MRHSASTSISEAVATHLVAASFDALPPAAEQEARKALLDAIGVMLAATGLSAEARRYGEAVAGHGRGASRILGRRDRTDPASAAFANGALAHVLDYGDCFDAGPAHPHAALVPVLLALADTRPSTTLGEALCAVAIGGDLACRLSLATARPFEAGGWYPPPLVNLIATAAASAKFMGLGVSQVVSAMSFALLSGCFPGALKHDRKSALRGTREAFAARGAVQAVSLAQSGAGGFSDPLGGEGAFFEVYGGGCRADVLLDQLGSRYLGAEVSFKPWPACRGTHAYIEAALDLRKRFDPRDVRVITAGVGPIQQMLALPLPTSPEPIGVTEAKFSIPFTVAAAFLDGEVGLGSFDDAHLGDERIRQFAAKVVATPVAGWGRQQAASGRLSVELDDGSSHEAEILEALGSFSRPLSDQALVDKFTECTEQAADPLPPEQAVAIVDGILRGKPDVLVSSIFDRLTPLDSACRIDGS